MEQAQIDNLRRHTAALSVAHEALNTAKRYRSHAAIALFEQEDYYALLRLAMAGNATAQTAQQILAALENCDYAAAQDLMGQLTPNPPAS